MTPAQVVAYETIKILEKTQRELGLQIIALKAKLPKGRSRSAKEVIYKDPRTGKPFTGGKT